ncbi:hypothetical protein [Burkholderia glumae]|uniref:Lipoprotein n=2 Tax=Burkholderia glumae TaxID=337 RepID=A0AAQ0BRW3_BURGL|nr:Lipoprotein [Burkholderia glumae BGR1]AJY64000.1 hypothetical protein KS03_3343 [Burkholderia glumae LMG 2196 = ATCC 33617]NVE26057.1 hypothetical protein [Burkholderia glumae]PNL04887.1 hypothetical protein CEQ24_002780 [Burkholderia glumae]QGA41431.1 hypothetical protein GAS19_20940 [Burkholderia glumae]
MISLQKKFPMSSRTPLIGLIAAALTLWLGACSSASDVSATDKPHVYTVNTTARSAVLSWGAAHRKAIGTADAYCAQQGMRASPAAEHVSDSEATLTFECHPTLVMAH